MIRWKVYLALGLAGFGIAVAAVYLDRIPTERSATQTRIENDPASRSAIGGPFSLVDHTGRPVTDKDFAGKFMLVFFGYTFCPDVCPTGLQTISEAIDILGNAGRSVQPIFITIDPERDTADGLADYVANFHCRLLGLTGTKEQVAAAAKAYRGSYFKVYAMPVPGEDEDAEEKAGSLMNHSAFIYLMGPDGGFREIFRHGTGPKAIASGIREYLDGRS